jgi:hypothetical protein
MTFSDSEIVPDWPHLDELKQRLDVESSDWDGSSDDSRLTRDLGTAIAYVKSNVGDWDELTGQVDEGLAMAALTAAIKFATLKTQEAAISAIRNDPAFQAGLRGHRKRFSIA